MEKLLAGEGVSGAYPALGVFTRREAEAALGELDLVTHIEDARYETLFEAALGQLPEGLSHLHDVVDQRCWRGVARVLRGRSVIARLIGWVIGFPPAAETVPVTVSMARQDDREVWVRDFGGRKFHSVLSLAGPRGSGLISERFGPVMMILGLETEGSEIHFPVKAARAFGVPLPAFLRPASTTREYADSEGRPCFDVSISMPIAGHVVSYKGWLEPTAPPLSHRFPRAKQ